MICQNFNTQLNKLENYFQRYKTVKKIILFFLLALTISVSAQDSLKNTVNTTFTLASKNVWRGVNYGDNAPSLQGNLSYNIKNAIEIGAFGTVTTNGTKKGYGNWLELYTTFKIDKWSLTFDDYYFFSYDSLNDYFNYGSIAENISPHLVEARLKYTDDKFTIFGSYNIWSNQDVQKSFYFEAEYFIRKDLSLIVGYLTGASWLNFHDKGGMTVAGISGSRDIVITDKFKIPVKTSLLFNPNYENIAKDPNGYVLKGLGTNPVNFVIALTF